MPEEPSANDPVAERPTDPSPAVGPVPSAGSSEGWTPVRTPPDWVGAPPPPPAVRTTGGVVAAVLLLVIGVGLLVWGVPAVIVHIRAATGMLGGPPPAGNFLRAGAAFLGFFLTFVGVGALVKVLRSHR